MKRFIPFIAAALLLATAAYAAPAPASPGPSPTADPAVCAHHFEVSVVQEATCVDKGLLAYTCSKCGLTYTAETLPTGEHTYEETDRTVTCTEDGQIVYTCSVCGDSYAQPAAAPGHVPDREAPDCENAVRCSVCGQTLIPAEGHDYEYQYDAVRDETGAFTDFGTWKCTKCGRTLAATEGNASFYYSLAEDADQAPAATGAPEEDAGQDVTPVPEATDAPAPDSAAEAPAPARSRTGLWIGIAVAVLAVVAAEAVVLTRSLRKKSDDR